MSVFVCRQYMVAIPAILEAGAETKFCASLLQPNETLVMTVTLMSQEENTILLQKTSSEEFHTCVPFKVSLSHFSHSFAHFHQHVCTTFPQLGKLNGTPMHHVFVLLVLTVQIDKIKTFVQS